MQCFAHFSRFCALKGRNMRKNIAVLASGSGTNAENIIRYFREKSSACVALVLTNRQNAFVLERSCGLEVPCFYFPKSDWENGEAILSVLREHDIDFVVLAGFLARVPDLILHAYPNKMINIHPSLLPKFGGKGMYGDRVHEAVIAAGEEESGITIHYTNEHYDEGAIICQVKCPVLPEDTPDDLAHRIHALEYDTYPKVIEKLLESEG
jgi:phosphoribosylglycinamide formyltransferase